MASAKRTVMRILFLLVFTAVVPSIAFAANSETLRAGDVPEQAKAERTIMLYLCGSDLEKSYKMGTHNLKQILSSRFSESGDVRFIVFTGGSKKWYLGEEGGGDNPYLYDPATGTVPREISKRYNQVWEARGVQRLRLPRS